MDLHDRELDSLIHQAVQSPVTMQQKQRAWEQLQLRLAQQAVLPVSAVVEPPPTLQQNLTRFLNYLWQHTRSFALEETRYEQARLGRHSGHCYSFSCFPGQLAIEFLGPLRVSALNQVC
jgi:hypothetical protein